jgi:hypothetical protein
MKGQRIRASAVTRWSSVPMSRVSATLMKSNRN